MTLKLKDLHSHTTYCDGLNTPEEMTLSAIEKELLIFGMSGHSYTFFDTSYCMSEEGTERYIAEINSLKEKYRNRIELLCGVEMDYYSAYPGDGFDYIIGSVHYLRCGDAYIPVDETPAILRAACEEHFGGDIYALCEAYYATVGDVVNRTGCDIIGHFDLITKFIEREPLFDTRHPRYIAAWQRAADQLLLTGVPFEVNTGAISRGYRTEPYPSREIIRYIKAHSGQLVLSSDAHSADAIAYGFSDF